ncbi:hypothetical protein CesoFtcFv8_019644 [Champsocephalus esox]|uniref:Ig-like domain-containing protein n=1 Tax=Champsocephalus esox TaxID=159716 RepID=A0AAN8BDS9_9TELE|nr:hypothetical protein CesoFtcFv8_019644 [Champsocephalus esox]
MGVGLAVVTLLIALMQGVSCQTWAVILPKTILVINDSCVTIPCRFTIPRNEEANILNCSKGVVWKKGSTTGPKVFIAHTPQLNLIQGEITGDVTKKNCTTTFHGFRQDNNDKYFFRLECAELTKYTFNNGVTINAQPDLPPSLLSSGGQVSEGAQVRLQCSVPVPCHNMPPSITWSPEDTSSQKSTQMQSSDDGQMIMMTTLTFSAAAHHNNQSFSCSVTYPLPAGGSSRSSATSQRLSVLYGPKDTVATVSNSAPVFEGQSVTLTCFSEANPPVSLYTWYRGDRGKLTKIGKGEKLVLQASQTDSALYLCEAQSPMASQRSRPVSLEVKTTTGRIEGVVLPYTICGVLLLLYIMTVVVDVYKYRGISRRLKMIEVKGEEHTDTNMRCRSVASDYDQLQHRPSEMMPHPDASTYENPVALQATFKNTPLSK